MVHVQSVLSMVQQVLCSVFHVQTGLMKMELKIIQFMVCKYFQRLKKYTFIQLAWTTDSVQRTIIAFSLVSTFQVRLPSGNDQTSLLYLIVYIRDELDCIAEYNISTVAVVPDSAGTADLINSIQSSSNGRASNPIVQLLASGNQNTVTQVLTSLSQQFNKMNNENVDKAVSSE
jgi:hypothetical protein